MGGDIYVDAIRGLGRALDIWSQIITGAEATSDELKGLSKFEVRVPFGSSTG